MPKAKTKSSGGAASDTIKFDTDIPISQELAARLRRADEINSVLMDYEDNRKSNNKDKSKK